MSSRAEVSEDIDTIIKGLGRASRELLSDGGGFTAHYQSLLYAAKDALHEVILKSREATK